MSEEQHDDLLALADRPGAAARRLAGDLQIGLVQHQPADLDVAADPHLAGQAQLGTEAQGIGQRPLVVAARRAMLQPVQHPAPRQVEQHLGQAAGQRVGRAAPMSSNSGPAAAGVGVRNASPAAAPSGHRRRRWSCCQADMKVSAYSALPCEAHPAMCPRSSRPPCPIRCIHICHDLKDGKTPGVTAARRR